MKALTIAIAITAAMTSALTARGNTAEPDTLVVVNNANRVTINRTPTANTIIITGSKDDEDFYYSYTAERVDSAAVAARSEEEWGLSLPFLHDEKRSKSKIVWGGNTQIGICMPLDGPAGLDQSVDLAIGKLVGVSYRPWSKGPEFSVGVGLFAQKFALHGNSMFALDGKSLVIVPLPADARDSHVRLFNFGFQLPVSFKQQIYRDFSVSAGVAMKLNTYTTASNKYTIDHRSYETPLRGLQQRILTYDVFACIGLEDIALYCRYSPVSLFKSGNGPQFDVLSFGINLGF
ncbi:MAG: hypothetical protein HDS54_02470 [Barnesiella sp.]|nr:hypothetical protein [Barnesiella sp.]